MGLLKHLLLGIALFTFYALNGAAERVAESSSSDEEKGFEDTMRSAIMFVSAFDPIPGNASLCTELYDLIMHGSTIDSDRTTEIGKLRTLNSTELFFLKKQVAIRMAALTAVRDHHGPFWHYAHKVREHVKKSWPHPGSDMKKESAIDSYLQRTENRLQAKALAGNMSEGRKADLQMRLQEIALLKEYRPDCPHAALFWLHVDAIHADIGGLEIRFHSHFKLVRFEPQVEIPKGLHERYFAKKTYIDEESERLHTMDKRFKKALQ